MLIETDSYVIGIENKIYSSVGNDLDDYGRYLEKRANKKKEIIKILLSLRKYDCIDSKGFQPLLYSELFLKVKELLGKYILEANSLYVTYLLDFMKTIRNLERGSAMDPELLKFLAEREDDIKQLTNSIKEAQEELKNKNINLARLVDINKYNKIKTQGFWSKESDGGPDGGLFYNSLYYDFPFYDNDTLVTDAEVRPSGWRIQFFFAKRRFRKVESMVGF